MVTMVNFIALKKLLILPIKTLLIGGAYLIDQFLLLLMHFTILTPDC